VFRKTLLLALLLAGPVWGQRATIPTEVHVQKNVPEVIALTEFDGDAVDWFIIDPGLAVFDISKLLGPGVATRPDRILVFAPAEGRYRVRAITAKVKDGKAALSAPTYCTVVVGNPPPTPTPPGPVPPGPTPPGPTPPGPAPVVGKKAVLILYETAEPNKLKGDQLSMSPRTRNSPTTLTPSATPTPPAARRGASGTPTPLSRPRRSSGGTRWRSSRTSPSPTSSLATARRVSRVRCRRRRRNSWPS
jgi:hypothetical protein